MEYISIPAIVIICYLIGEVFKVIIKKKSHKKLIPIVVGISGGILGLVAYNISPEIMLNIDNQFMAVAVGIISGLASTGGNQVWKQLTSKKGEDN